MIDREWTQGIKPRIDAKGHEMKGVVGPWAAKNTNELRSMIGREWTQRIKPRIDTDKEGYW